MANAMFLENLRDDIRSIIERDPAAHTVAEVVLCYPGLKAVALHRVSHWLWTHDFRLLGRALSQFGRFLTGIEIHPGAKIGRRLLIDHGMGVVIGATAEIGDDCTLYHGVTLGGTSLIDGKRHPTLGNNVIVGSGAQILGPFTVGDGARIGANAVVVAEVPAHATMVGIPARAVAREPALVAKADDVFLPYGTPCEDLPDPVARAVTALMGEITMLRARVEELEQREEKGVDALINPRFAETVGPAKFRRRGQGGPV
jgi:serine O-acetyltransferase